MHTGTRQASAEMIDISGEDDLSNVNVKSLVSDATPLSLFSRFSRIYEYMEYARGEESEMTRVRVLGYVNRYCSFLLVCYFFFFNFIFFSFTFFNYMFFVSLRFFISLIK